MPSKASVAIVGSGNISTDLLYKLLRSDWLEPRWMVGIDPNSEGLARARKLGLETTHEGVDWLLAQSEKPDLVFEATSAYVHRDAAPKYETAGIRAIDLTPAAVGPAVIPPVEPPRTPRRTERQHDHLRWPGDDSDRVRGIAGGARSVRRDRRLRRLSLSGAGHAGQHRRVHRTTSRGIETIGGAARGKAIIVLNPADPPIIMRNTIFCSLPPDADLDAVRRIDPAMVAEVRRTCRATGCSTSRNSSEPSMTPRPRSAESTDPRSRSKGRAITCPLRGQPRHHDRGGHQGRRGDRQTSLGDDAARTIRRSVTCIL